MNVVERNKKLVSELSQFNRVKKVLREEAIEIGDPSLLLHADRLAKDEAAAVIQPAPAPTDPQIAAATKKPKPRPKAPGSAAAKPSHPLPVTNVAPVSAPTRYAPANYEGPARERDQSPEKDPKRVAFTVPQPEPGPAKTVTQPTRSRKGPSSATPASPPTSDTRKLDGSISISPGSSGSTDGKQFDQFWVEQKRQALERRTRRMYRAKLAKIVVDHWRHVARFRLFRLKINRVRMKAVLADVFLTWREHAADNKHEWRLNILAQSHLRMVLMRRYFTILKQRTRLTNQLSQKLFLKHAVERWLLALHKRRVLRAKLQRADRHRAVWMLMQSLRKWKLFVVNNRKMAHATEKAYLFQYGHSTGRAFRTWVRYVQQRREKREHKDLADRFAAVYAKQRLLHIWRMRCQERAHLAALSDAALMFNDQRLKRLWFVAFRRLRKLQKRHDEDKEAASKFHTKKAVKRVFDRWLSKVQGRREMIERAMNAQAVDFRRNYMLHSAWDTWKQKALRSVDHKRKLGMAFERTRHRFLRLGLAALWDNRCLRMTKRERNRQAALFRHMSLQQKFLCKWQHKLRSVIDDATKERFADAHLRRHRFRVAFDHWRAYTDHKLFREQQRRRAVRHSYLSLLRKHFNAMKQFVEYRRTRWEDKEVADGLRERFHARRALRAWARALGTARQDRMKRAQSSLFWKKRLLSKCVHAWRCFVLENQMLRDSLTKALRHWMLTVLRKHWRAWRGYTSIHSTKRIQKEDELSSAKHKIHSGVLGRALRAWVEVHHRWTIKRIMIARAKGHFEDHLTKRVWRAWLRYISSRRHSKTLRLLADRHLAFRLTRAAVRDWRQRVDEWKFKQARAMAATRVYHIRLVRKAWQALQEYAKRRADKQKMYAAAVQSRRMRLLKKGASQWLKIGLGMRSQRMRAAAERQAQNSVRLFMRVQRIAQHWRSLVLRRRAAAQQQGHQAPPPALPALLPPPPPSLTSISRAISPSTSLPGSRRTSPTRREDLSKPLVPPTVPSTSVLDSLLQSTRTSSRTPPRRPSEISVSSPSQFLPPRPSAFSPSTAGGQQPALQTSSLHHSPRAQPRRDSLLPDLGSIFPSLSSSQPLAPPSPKPASSSSSPVHYFPHSQLSSNQTFGGAATAPTSMPLQSTARLDQQNPISPFLNVPPPLPRSHSPSSQLYPPPLPPSPRYVSPSNFALSQNAGLPPTGGLPRQPPQPSRPPDQTPEEEFARIEQVLLDFDRRRQEFLAEKEERARLEAFLSSGQPSAGREQLLQRLAELRLRADEYQRLKEAKMPEIRRLADRIQTLSALLGAAQ